MDPDTRTKQPIYAIADASEDPGTCHSNAINWWPDQELYTVSVLYWDSIVAFTRTGQLAWVMGGEPGQAYFPGITWNRQHNHHLLPDSLLLFSNQGNDAGSAALEFSTTSGSVEPVFSYSPEVSSNTFGDAKRLPNGNTLVTFSNAGLIHEVDSSGQAVQTISFSSPIGYTLRRKTLYGPPPPYGE